MALHPDIQEEPNHSLEFNKPLKYCVYGNCQAENLHYYLDCSPTFKSTFTYHHIPGIYQLTQSDVDFVELVMSDCDLIIYQKIGHNYGKLSTQHLFEERLQKPTCTLISFPSLYFRGYNPELHPPHYDETIMYNHIINWSNASHFEEVFLNLNLFEKNVSLFYVEESLNELGLREADIDLKFSDFIRSNYRKERLFHTFNHPTSGLMAELAGRVLEKIGVDDFSKENARNISCSLLSNFHFPLYPSNAQNLDIEFSENLLYRYAGQDYNIRDFYNLMRKTIKSAIRNNQMDSSLLRITHLKLRTEVLNTTQTINEFVGYIDQIADNQVKGWVFNRNDYDDFLEVDIYQDGIKLDTVNAELYRPDIKDAGYGTGNYGFCYDSPVSLKSSLIVVKVAHSDYELPRSEMYADNLLSQLHQTQAELEQSQSQLHQTQEVLEKYQSQLHQTQAELEKSQSRLHQTENKLEEWQAKYQQIQEQLQQAKSQGSAHQTELQQRCSSLTVQLHILSEFYSSPGKINEAPICKSWGNIFQTLGQIDQAERWYIKALEIQSDFAPALANLGSIYAMKQQWEKAITAYERAIAIQPCAGFYRNLAKVFAQLNNQAEACECGYVAFMLEPNTATAEDYLTLGNTLLQVQKTQHAMICFRRAVYLKPDCAEAYGKIGDILLSQGQRDEAIAHYRKTIEIKPNLSEVRQKLGGLLGQTGEVQAGHDRAE
ncbi:WcbI family polysaccharide biosynthesis putative acetyltransferase [Microcoleus sp. T3_A4]|uniref:WcbI family polysaccharide biosynthesis putative acetyltransferase n=1 Tax=Microcoleus sp. T3_A4 TaxID=2818968 RepID=UPI002FCF11DE